MTGQNNRISQLDIERWLLGELNEAERARLENSLSAEIRAEISAQDQALRRSLFERRPPRVFAASVIASTTERTRRFPVSRGAARALAIPALAAIAVTVWISSTPDKLVNNSPNATRLLTPASERAKGLAPQLRVYRKQGAHAELLSDRASVRPRDLLQLGYVSAGRPYGVVISIDGAGAVTLHSPADPSQSSALAPGSGEHPLPAAYELDSAPAFERFFFVVSREPINPDAVLSVARDFAKNPAEVARLPIPVTDGLEQYSLLLLKDGL
jgi:hypothetical protein